MSFVVSKIDLNLLEGMGRLRLVVLGLYWLVKIGSLPRASLGELDTKKREMINRPRLRRLPPAAGPGRVSTVEN